MHLSAEITVSARLDWTESLGHPSRKLLFPPDLPGYLHHDKQGHNRSDRNRQTRKAIEEKRV